MRQASRRRVYRKNLRNTVMDDEGESFDTAQKKQKITFIFISFSV